MLHIYMKKIFIPYISLCRPQSNKYKGLPFKPSRAVTIDLFPQTEHCELMVEFVRIKEEEDYQEEEENGKEQKEERQGEQKEVEAVETSEAIVEVQALLREF